MIKNLKSHENNEWTPSRMGSIFFCRAVAAWSVDVVNCFPQICENLIVID